jgi:hypothetical protein
MQQKIGKKWDYRDLREGIHSITLSLQREGAEAIIQQREISALGGENWGREDKLLLSGQIFWWKIRRFSSNVTRLAF